MLLQKEKNRKKQSKNKDVAEDELSASPAKNIAARNVTVKPTITSNKAAPAHASSSKKTVQNSSASAIQKTNSGMAATSPEKSSEYNLVSKGTNKEISETIAATTSGSRNGLGASAPKSGKQIETASASSAKLPSVPNKTKRNVDALLEKVFYNKKE